MKKLTEKLIETIKNCEGKYQKVSEDKVYCPLIPVNPSNFFHKMCPYQSVLINIIPRLEKNIIKYKCNFQTKNINTQIMLAY